MELQLNDILKLEDSEEFENAFEAYENLYSKNRLDYEIWEHFYFFLWILIEEMPSNLSDKINLRELLSVMLDDGTRNFSNKAAFNFIAGYTVSIFPFEYGDKENLENIAKQMLRKAVKLDPNNSLFKMVWLASRNRRIGYKTATIRAAQQILDDHNGIGLKNKYFKEVFYRIGI
jgi:hypothetical protein